MHDDPSKKDERLERALVRSEIHELVAEAAYLLDRGRFDELVELHTEDCEMLRPLPPFDDGRFETIRGREALAQSFRDPVSWPDHPRRMRHVVSNLRLTRLAADHLAGTLALIGYRHEGPGISAAMPMMVGDYDDEYRRDGDGRWRIHRRKVVIEFLNPDLIAAAMATVSQTVGGSMPEKFELASEAWFAEAFRLFAEAARENPDVTFSVCEVFTKVPERLGPDAEGKIAWTARVEGGRADCRMGEVPAQEVDVKTVAEWEAVVPAARYKIDLQDPSDFVRYQEVTAKAVAEGRIVKQGDSSKAPLAFVAIHNALAERTS